MADVKTVRTQRSQGWRSEGAMDVVLPEPDEKSRVVEEMFDRIAPRYDALNRVLTFRMDVRWRDIAVETLQLRPGARVLDLATGTGDLCRTVQGAGGAPVGADFSFGMLRAARAGGAPLVRADALRLPFGDASFDALTCGFALRNFVALPPVFAECARVLRVGARIALLDVAEPAHPLLRAGHNVWFRHVVPFVGGLVSDRDAYRYLPASTAYLPGTGELFAMLASAGFVECSRRPLGLGAAQLVTGRRA
jgi:demethylmenaquinone methyltransferase / 2-methoxy-6-polyprenyl-1,4-benzoquinol methylase